MKDKMDNGYWLAKLEENADKLRLFSCRLVVFGNKDLYAQLTKQIDDIEITIAAIKQEQEKPENFIY